MEPAPDFILLQATVAILKYSYLLFYSLYKATPYNRIPIFPLLYKQSTASFISKSFATSICQSMAIELRIITLHHITDSFLRNSYLCCNLSIKQLYVARAISTYSTTSLLQWIGFLIAYRTPKLILKNTANSTAIIKNMPTLKQLPAHFRGSVRSIII